MANIYSLLCVIVIVLFVCCTVYGCVEITFKNQSEIEDKRYETARLEYETELLKHTGKR